jgi:hypothetical protein
MSWGKSITGRRATIDLSAKVGGGGTLLTHNLDKESGTNWCSSVPETWNTVCWAHVTSTSPSTLNLPFYIINKLTSSSSTYIKPLYIADWWTTSSVWGITLVFYIRISKYYRTLPSLSSFSDKGSLIWLLSVYLACLCMYLASLDSVLITGVVSSARSNWQTFFLFFRWPQDIMLDRIQQTKTQAGRIIAATTPVIVTNTLKVSAAIGL